VFEEPPVGAVGTGILDEDDGGEGAGGVGGVTMGETTLVVVGRFVAEGVLVGPTGTLLDDTTLRQPVNPHFLNL